MAAQADTVGPSVEEAPPKLVETPVETVAEVRKHHVHDLYTMYVRAHVPVHMYIRVLLEVPNCMK